MAKMINLDYQDEETTLEGCCVYPATTEDRPVVLVFHDWSGRNEFAIKKAEKLAELGYVGFAVDMFGKGKIGKTKEEKTALMQPLVEDRAKLQKRALAAFDFIQTVKGVDAKKIAAIGFCFGGLCALDLARSGANARGVVSFHGLLTAPPQKDKTISAKILVLHGFSDPMVPPAQVEAFGNEMTKAKADWQLNMYGNAMHGFTNPEANDPGFGTVYNKEADTRSWQAMKQFFKEIL